MIKSIIFVALLTISSFVFAQQPVSSLDQVFLNETLHHWIVETYPKNISADKAILVSEQILRASKNENISLDLLVGVISQESGFKTTAVSREGAKGLMQVIPKWHQDKILGRKLSDPKVGIEVGTMVLKDCLNNHNQDHKKALACYSGGTGKQAMKYYQLVLTKSKQFKDRLLLAAFFNDTDIDFNNLRFLLAAN